MYSPIKILFLIILVQFSLSEFCTNSEFDEIKTNEHVEFQVSPGYEKCLRYSLPDSKEKISLMFFGSDSTTSEVVIYKLKSDISMKGDSYEKFNEKFLIHENEFMEINVKDYEDNVYIIIRDPKDEDTNQGTMILYDSQIPIPLINGIPLYMKKFMDNIIYEFTYTSVNNLTFVFSTKVKSKKYLTVKYGDETKVSRTLYATDEIVYCINPDTTEKKLVVNVEEIEPGKENEDFSVILYEGGPGYFREIVKYNETTIHYINLDKKDEKQVFNFYYFLDRDYESNTINFMLDPLANKTGYINISAGLYHSPKKLTEDEMEKLFHFDQNKLPIAYDDNSDIYKRIYFKDEVKDFDFRYIFFRVEISKLEQYFSSKDFIITISEPTEIIDLREADYYVTKELSLDVEYNFPKYYKLLLDKNEKYIITSPVPNDTLFLEGDLLIKNETTQIYTLNKNYFEDPDEIFELQELSEFTIRIFGNELIRKKIYIEKYSGNDVMVNEFSRNDYPIDIEMTQDDCLYNRKKYILGIFDKDLYPKGDETVVTKYWTTKNGGDMRVYYRDNIFLEGDSLFPMEPEYLLEKDTTFFLDNYIDFFTISCIQPGIFSLRSLHKEYDEDTFEISENSMETFGIEGERTQIILLNAPIKPPTEYLYFALLSVDGEPITIEPDTPGMFNTTTIKGDQLFKLPIKLANYKPDELAIRINSTERTTIEASEVIRYDNTKLIVVKENDKTKINGNHFVKFLDKNFDEYKVKVYNLKGVPISWVLVDLATDDTNYLPLATQFKEEYNISNTTLGFDEDSIPLKNSFKGRNNNKKYLAFIFSIRRPNLHEFEVEFEENKSGGNTILIIILILVGIIVIVCLVILIIFIISKTKKSGAHEGKFDEIDGPTTNQPLTDEQ